MGQVVDAKDLIAGGKSCIQVWEKNRGLSSGRWRFEHSSSTNELVIRITPPEKFAAKGAKEWSFAIPGMTPERMEAWASLGLYRKTYDDPDRFLAGSLVYCVDGKTVTANASEVVVEWQEDGLRKSRNIYMYPQATMFPIKKDAIFWMQFSQHLRRLARAVRSKNA